MESKTFRILVVVFLGALVLIQGIGLIPVASGPNDECTEIIVHATDVLGEALLNHVDRELSFQSAVYEDPDNINQQIFRIGEMQYLALNDIAAQQSAILELQLSCVLGATFFEE